MGLISQSKAQCRTPDTALKLTLPGINATVRIVKISQLRNLLLIAVVVFSNTDLHQEVKSVRIASTFIY